MAAEEMPGGGKERKPNMKTIKIGIIGNGGISHFHAEGYKKIPNVEIYALCDINLERAEAMAKEYNVPHERVFTNVEDLVALPEIDAVSVCTWNSAHAPCTIAALRAGKHVLCEKPMALNAAEAEQMEQEAKKAGKLLMIGFVRRFGNDCDVLRDFIDLGFFGDLYYAKAAYLRRHGCPGGWFCDKARSGGGPLIDLGVHVIDLVRFLMGNPQPVSVYGATFDRLGNRPGVRSTAGYISSDASGAEDYSVEDLATAMIRFDNGAVLSVETSFSLNLKEDRGDIELFGTKGGAKLSPELELYSQTGGYMTDTRLSYPTALSFDGLFEREMAHFVDCVRTGGECRNPAADGVALMKILDAVYESARTGHEVTLG